MATQVRTSRVIVTNILLATDFSAASQNALEYAIALARRHEARLFVTHAVVPDLTGNEIETQWPLHESQQKNAEREMAILERRRDLEELPHQFIVRSGDASKLMASVISEENIDLVVMGTHARMDLIQLFTGSIAENIIRCTTCPVLTVGPNIKLKALSRFKHILYATDFGENSLQALNYALAFAESEQSALTMLHVIESVAVSESELADWQVDDSRKLRELVPVDAELLREPEIQVQVGAPAEEILHCASARNTDLIVMGSRQGGFLSVHLPWNTLHHVVQHALCPVLTVCSG